MTTETVSRPTIGATVLGYPRIGRRRELKKALEAHWADQLSADELHRVAAELRTTTIRRLADLGLDSVPSNTFSLYDHVLDTAVLVGAVPERFQGIKDPLARYFAMARGSTHDQPSGTDHVAPLEMTKWYDTNYHYLVPEIGPETKFRLDAGKPLSEYQEALAAGVETRPVVLGPGSLLLLAKAADGAPREFRPFDRIDALTDVYAELLGTLAEHGVAWIQLDEPSYVADRTDAEIAALRRVYQRLGELQHRPAILVASYFGQLGDALPALAATPVDAIGLDFVDGTRPESLTGVPALAGKTVVAGIVDGRNVWRADLESALGVLATLLGLAGDVAVAASCSLMHVPYDLEAETRMDPRIRSWLAFADQKVREVVTLAHGLRVGRDEILAEIETATAVRQDRTVAPGVVDPVVRERLAELGEHAAQRNPYAQRRAAQDEVLRLPVLPTTTIGSFPQTDEIRAARAAHRAGRMSSEEYAGRMRAEIERVVRLQEQIGLDVLVHGEPERNDMVQYFAELLDGFVTSQHGWVQSYGSRCVRPPILYGDVNRPRPMTVEWAAYAQSLTDRPVKGMLTGPITILAWSFVRDDEPAANVARQIALAIRDETADLEAAGISIIQVDDPALRELLPLRVAERAEYLRWSVEAFRLATSGVADSTQIHTHLCYSEFSEVISAIDAFDADVTSVEAARSRMEILTDLAASGFGRGIGPGVYDIHSPQVPGTGEIQTLLNAAASAIPTHQLWVNPDCGLKTRTYDEVEPALTAMVAAARQAR